MANEYETLTNLKLACGIPPSDTRDDVLLQKALTVASRSIDNKCSLPTIPRRFYLDADASARTYSTLGRLTRIDEGELLDVDDIGSLTGLVVESGTSSAGWTAITTYETVPDNAFVNARAIEQLLRTGGSWPRGGTTRVRITAKWGWPVIPDCVIEATLILATRLFKRKDSPEGVIGSSDWTVVTNLAKTDPDVVALLSGGGVIRKPRGFA